MRARCCGGCRTASLDRVFILFPDPWPKKRHVKRRLINRALVDQLARVMRRGAELRIGTDIGDYLRTILLAMRGRPAFAWQVQGPAGLAACGRPTGRRPATRPRPAARGAAAIFYALCGRDAPSTAGRPLKPLVTIP